MAGFPGTIRLRHFVLLPALAMAVAIGLSRLAEHVLGDRLGATALDAFHAVRMVVIGTLMASIIGWLATRYRRQYELQLQARNKELEETQEFLSGIIRDSAEAIVTLGVDDRITSWNRAAERIFGWRAEEVIGRDVHVLLPGDVRVRRERDEAFERIRAGETVQDHQTTRVRKDGRPVAVRISWSPLHDAAGRHVGTTGIVLDVSAEREMRERLVERERLAAVGEMAAHVAHEIRNPLAGIRGACEILFKPGVGASKEIGDEVLHQIDRLNQTVTELLQFSNPREPAKVPTDLAGLIDRVVSAFQAAPKAREVAVVRRYAADLAPVEIDPGQVEQVLYNLVLNAAQAMDYRGSIRLETGTDGEWAEIVVGDEGPGLSPDALTRAFTPFFTTRTAGTGLGLSIVRKVVAAHGGTVTASNPPAGGAEFRIRLPLKERGPADPAGGRAPGARNTTGTPGSLSGARAES